MNDLKHCCIFNFNIVCVVYIEEDSLDIPTESTNSLKVDLQNSFAESREALTPMEKGRGAKSRQEISKDISLDMERQKQMTKHFIELNDRVEAVWSKLQVPNSIDVALVGMGGTAEEGL